MSGFGLISSYHRLIVIIHSTAICLYIVTELIVCGSVLEIGSVEIQQAQSETYCKIPKHHLLNIIHVIYSIIVCSFLLILYLFVI